MHQGEPNAVEPQTLAQETALGLLAARRLQRQPQIRFRALWKQIPAQRHGALARDGLAQQTRRGVDETALQAMATDEGLALAREHLLLVLEHPQHHAFQGGARVALQQSFRPGVVESAIRGLQRRTLHAGRLQGLAPASVTAQASPAAAAQREDHGACTHLVFPRWRLDVMCSAILRDKTGRDKPQPAMAHVQGDTAGAQTLQPGSQQGRGLESHGEDAAGTADEGSHAQAGRPCADTLGIQTLQPGGHRSARRVALQKVGRGFRVSEIESADAGTQKLAPGRRHGVDDMDRHACGGDLLGGHQAGRPRTDYQHGQLGRQRQAHVSTPQGGIRRASSRGRAGMPDASSARRTSAQWPARRRA